MEKTMTETVVGILGFLCIIAIVVILFKSKTLPSIAFIVFPFILAMILVAGGYYSVGDIASLIKSGFSSTRRRRHCLSSPCYTSES